MRTGHSMAPQTRDSAAAVVDKQPLSYSSPIIRNNWILLPFYQATSPTPKVNYEFVPVPDTPYFTCSIFLLSAPAL